MNADISYTAGSTKTGMSAVELSGTTAATTATFRIMGFQSDPDNSATGSANVNVIVKFNEHFYVDPTGVLIMAINRAQLAKELEPGLNALFGMEYARYEAQHTEIFDTESSDRAFEEETLIVGFGNAEVKAEGSGVRFDTC